MSWAHFPAVDIDRVGQCFKGVERDADGKDEIEMQRRGVQPKRARNGLRAVQKEIEILEESEYLQVDETTEKQQPFSIPFSSALSSPSPTAKSVTVEMARRKQNASPSSYRRRSWPRAGISPAPGGSAEGDRQPRQAPGIEKK